MRFRITYGFTANHIGQVDIIAPHEAAAREEFARMAEEDTSWLEQESDFVESFPMELLEITIPEEP